MKRLLAGAALSALVGLLHVGSAEGATISLTGACAPDAPGLCSKTLTFDDVSDVLTIDLTNTSPAANGGYITGDAFWLPSNTVVSGSSSDADFQFIDPLLNQPSGGDVNFTLGRTQAFALGGDWEGGGSPSAGTGTGQTVTFTVTLNRDLTALEFSDVFRSQAIRFRGFTDGSSDKDLVVPGGNVTPIPEPASLLLFGLALSGAGLQARRKFTGR